MTGAGFGGCILCLVKQDQVESLKSIIAQPYQEQTGFTPAFYPVMPGDGVRRLW